MSSGVSLSQSHPNLSLLWDYELNGSLTPHDVVAGSAKQAYWICQLGHSTRSPIRVKVRGSGCGVCSNRILLKGYNDLSTVYPALAAEWNFERNGELKPDEVLAGARATVWWKCANGHEWKVGIYSRNGGKNRCMTCGNRKVATGENDIQTMFPDLIEEWDFTRNSSHPSSVLSGSQTKFYWICPEQHSYIKTPYNRTVQGQSCPICNGRKILAGFNDFETKYPEKAKLWNNELNGGLVPSKIASSDRRRFYWDCSTGHVYVSSVSQVVKGYGCGVCSGKQVLAGFNDLASKAPKLASEWSLSENGGLLPTEVTPGSEQVVRWNCPEGHIFSARIDNRFYLQRGCNVCSNHTAQAGFNDLKSQYPLLAKEWDSQKNGALDSSQVTFESTSKAWWICSKGHSFKSQINFRATRGVGCPRCAKLGFDQSSPAVFYFIENTHLRARKIGISNESSDRLELWVKKGWTVIWTYGSSDGKVVMDLETKVLRWIRKELGLPPFLGSEELGAIGGWSETFSIEGVPNEEVLSKVSELLEAILNL